MGVDGVGSGVQPLQLRGLANLAVQLWHTKVRWFKKRVKEPSERGLCNPHR